MNKPATQELLPPERTQSAHSTDRPSMFHWLIEPLQDRLLLPLTGLWILGLDWLLFPPEGATFMLATPVAAVLGFIFGSAGVYQFQRRFAGDDKLQGHAQSDPGRRHRRHPLAAGRHRRRRLDPRHFRADPPARSAVPQVTASRRTDNPVRRLRIDGQDCPSYK